jgi:phosphoribosylanthranilate isomerase
MRTLVKICGITRWEDAELAAKLGAAALGFNFYPPSPRYIAPHSAKAIIRKMPPFVTAVGIFANETDGARVASVAREAGVTAIQLHGPGSPLAGPTAEALDDLTIIQAFAVGKQFNPEALNDLKANAFMLDTFDPVLIGGTGKTFDWNVAREAKKYGALILAGGLTAENVGEAIRGVRPFAVDVASGVESEPGKKDPEKLRAFFAAVAEADESR